MNYELLRQKRIDKDLCQYEMARLIGVSTKTYNFKENGKREFTRTEIIKIGKCLKLNIHEVNDIFLEIYLPNGN